MNAEIFAVAISNILFGFVVGLAVEAFSSKIQFEKLNEAIQKAIDTMFHKDEQIDELTSELKTLRSQYSQLYEAAETSRRSLENVRNLPPPSSPLMRSEHYVDSDIPRVCEFPDPQTPKSTCVPSSTG
jgi:FtsZ-binding cell division protein ZapB